MHKTFFDLDQKEQENLLIKNIEGFCKEKDTFDIEKVKNIQKIDDYIWVDFDTVNVYQYKTFLFNMLANPLGEIVYSIYNEKCAFDLFYVDRKYRNQGIGNLLIYILKNNVYSFYNKKIPIYVTPIVFDVPMSKTIEDDIEHYQKNIEKFYRNNDFIIVEDAAESVFLN